MTNWCALRPARRSALDSGSALINRDRLVVQGTLEGQVSNRASTVMSGGTLRGSVANTSTGTFSGTGTVWHAVEQRLAAGGWR